MRNRIIAYLLVALLAAFAWLHVMIAREHAAAEAAHAEARAVLYQATVVNLAARMEFQIALHTYRDALGVCGARSQKQEARSQNSRNVLRVSR